MSKKICREQKPYYWINISQNISGTKYGFGNLHPDHATVYYKYLPCDIVTISNSKMQNCLKIFFKRYTTYLSSILENLEKISCRPKSFWCQTIVFFLSQLFVDLYVVTNVNAKIIGQFHTPTIFTFMNCKGLKKFW